jgi:hypothetical protein
MKLLVPERDPEEELAALENPREGGTEELDKWLTEFLKMCDDTIKKR